ncbi:alpha/beta fold hydrolase [Streptomyces sp. JW3]|uniref:alpha/beta fold hydrolase n=1 Tax=Streptomyces sp. JW3 TaxID=3456955 RepID=UPI003FA405CF
MTFVLVPGAWHGAWAWHGVAQRIQARGQQAFPLTMPGLAPGEDSSNLRMEDAVSHIVKEIERRNLHDVVLVGHSWGGAPITAVAHRIPERVAKVIYYSAFVPQRGVSMNDENLPENAAYVRAAIEASPNGTVGLSFELFQQFFMQGVPEAAQRLAFDLLLPHPGGYMLDALDVDPVTTLGIPAAYVLAEQDLALARPGAEFAARIGVAPIMVPGTHESLLTHPEELAEALLGA